MKWFQLLKCDIDVLGILTAAQTEGINRHDLRLLELVTGIFICIFINNTSYLRKNSSNNYTFLYKPL